MVFAMSSKLFTSLLCALAIFTTSDAAALKTNKRQNSTSTAIQHVPIKIASTTPLGYASDKSFNPGIFRDGGGGGLINGINVVVFADSWTTISPYGPNNNGTSFVHNTIAYMGIRNASDPTNLYDFGTGAYGDGNRRFMSTNSHVLTGLVAASGTNESAPNLPPHTTVAIWPNSNLVALKGSNSGLAVYPMFNITNLSFLYSTMVQIDIAAPEDIPSGSIPNATRIVPRLFYAGENTYGSFALYRSGTLPGEPNDNNLYMFSSSSNGIKVARVNLANKAQRGYYTYWNGSKWANTQPKVSDVNSDIIAWNFTLNYNGAHAGPYGPGTGEFFWSAYFQTYVCIFMGDAIADAFFISYSTSKTILGPWTKPQNILNTARDPNCSVYSLNYAGHAYPGWDTTGKTMLLSYSSCNSYITMYQLTFA